MLGMERTRTVSGAIFAVSLERPKTSYVTLQSYSVTLRGPGAAMSLDHESLMLVFEIRTDLCMHGSHHDHTLDLAPTTFNGAGRQINNTRHRRADDECVFGFGPPFGKLVLGPSSSVAKSKTDARSVQ